MSYFSRTPRKPPAETHVADVAKDDRTLDRATQVDQVGVVARWHRVLVKDGFILAFQVVALGVAAVLIGDGAEPANSESVYVCERVGREAVVARAVAGIVLPEFGKVMVVDCGWHFRVSFPKSKHGTERIDPLCLMRECFGRSI